MARPRKHRCIHHQPVATFYKPRGIALHDLQGITLPLEGLEALRLVDAEGMSRERAAQMMNVSAPTLCRILAEARSIVAKALTNGWAIRIDAEGNYHFVGLENEGSSGHGRQRYRKKKRQG